MAYNKTNWKNLPNTTTPITAENLNNIETGVDTVTKNVSISEYSASNTYIVGDYCIYNKEFYRCLQDIKTGETFNISKWEKTTVSNELKRLSRPDYSNSDEQVVGTWIDGKTLYRKMVTANFSITERYANWYLEVFDNKDEIDKCWTGNMGYIQDGIEIVPLNHEYQGNDTFFSSVMTSMYNKALRVHSTGDRINQTIVVEIYYTKV